jgi:DNA-binding NtrC family response regulator
VEDETKAKAVPRGSATILLVEDDEMVRNLVRETLERQGYKMIDAADPLEARRIADHHKGAIQLLITDVVMPRLNGKDLALQVSQRRPDIKVLYMSGYTDSAIVNSGILQKEVAFLQKPFTPAALIEKVHDVLEGDGKTRHAGE